MLITCLNICSFIPFNHNLRGTKDDMDLHYILGSSAKVCGNLSVSYVMLWFRFIPCDESTAHVRLDVRLN